MLSSDSPGTLSLSLSAKITKLPSDSPGSRCQSHHSNLSLSLVTLQALSLSLAKVTKPLTQQTQITHATQLSMLQLSRCHLFSTLTTTARNPIACICQIYHTSMGHRYFNLAMTCGICLRYAHASHKPASAFRLPTL